MRIIHKAATLLALLTVTACAGRHPHPPQAQHPAYIHALSDLRLARALLRDHPRDYAEIRDEAYAGDALNNAIFEIRRAAVDDGRDPNWNPPVDSRLDHRGRLSQALELINSADRDLREEEDNPAARGWRNDAFHRLDEARHGVEQALRDRHLDEERRYY